MCAIKPEEAQDFSENHKRAWLVENPKSRTARTRLYSELPRGVMSLLLFSSSEHDALVVLVGVVLQHQLVEACRGFVLVMVFLNKVKLLIIRRLVLRRGWSR